jgi:hypothetical protein
METDRFPGFEKRNLQGTKNRMSNLPRAQAKQRIRVPRTAVGTHCFRAFCLNLFCSLIPLASGVNAQEPATSKTELANSERAASTSPEANPPVPSRSRSTPPGSPTKTEPPKTERQLAEERKARDAARKRGEITFDDLKFDIEKGGEFKKEMITKEIGELDKKTVKLRGFILPTSVFQNSGIKQFVLVRDNQECCFGPGALLFDCVIIEMEPGKTATFSTRVVSVKGKLEIDSESFRYPEGGHYAIYKMTAEEVK